MIWLSGLKALQKTQGEELEMREPKMKPKDSSWLQIQASRRQNQAKRRWIVAVKTPELLLVNQKQDMARESAPGFAECEKMITARSGATSGKF